jgi:hypothetical protein
MYFATTQMCLTKDVECTSMYKKGEYFCKVVVLLVDIDELIQITENSIFLFSDARLIAQSRFFAFIKLI